MSPTSNPPSIEGTYANSDEIFKPLASVQFASECHCNSYQLLEQQYNFAKDKVTRFVEHLKSIQDDLVAELANYQSHSASQDEFYRIYECLESLKELRTYLSRRAKTAAVFLPLNMPLYAFCLYGLLPALVTDRVYIRAPERMTPLIGELIPLLKIERYFPNISIEFMERGEFVRTHVTDADIIIFTGKLRNAQNILAQTKQESLFLFNGRGCNPHVLGEGSNLKFAAKKTVDARLFCSGQDCAAPDIILVHRDDQVNFVQNLKHELNEIKIGDYRDPTVRVGKLADPNQIQLISKLLLKHKDNIVYGGCIDFGGSIIHPTIIVTPLGEDINFEELFSPIFFVSVYDSDAELARYFEHPKYLENEMYISLFGASPYVEARKRSIIIRDRVVFDTDRGNDEFGGYSTGASFVSSHKSITAKPILVPRDIFEFLGREGIHRKLSPAIQKKISKRVSVIMKDIFSGNLIFGFTYGSIARGTATQSSDINTIVVVHNIDLAQVERYETWLADYHRQMRLVPKEGKLVQILKYVNLEDLLRCENSYMNGNSNSLETTKKHLWRAALVGAQKGVVGDKSRAIECRHKLLLGSQEAQKLNGTSAVEMK